jgi:hypothetical protein
MELARTTPAVASIPELRSFVCRSCREVASFRRLNPKDDPTKYYTAVVRYYRGDGRGNISGYVDSNDPKFNRMSREMVGERLFPAMKMATRSIRACAARCELPVAGWVRA